MFVELYQQRVLQMYFSSSNETHIAWFLIGLAGCRRSTNEPFVLRESIGFDGWGDYGILIVMFVEFRVARSRHNVVVGRLVPAPF